MDEGEGEIFYLQKRVGKEGQVFGLFKFATMLKDSPNLSGGDITMGNRDPRILPFGNILRKTKINELPQLINIIKGDMVFIGPNDLAQALLGYTPARGDEPEFVEAIEKIVAAARKHGKWAARMVNNGVTAKEGRKKYDTVAMTGDTKAIQNWYISEIEVANS